jgi:hypothetical protein
LLRNNFGAEGNGINEMLDGLGDKIPYDLQQSLRYIASVRNKAAHSYALEIVDTDGFLNQCKSAISSLEVLSTNEFTPFGSPPRGFAPSQQSATSDAREPYELKYDPGRDSGPSRSAGSGSSWDWQDTFEMCWVGCWGTIRIVVGLCVAALPLLVFYWIGSGVVSWFRSLDIRPQTQPVSQVQPSAECQAKFTEFTVWAQQWQPLTAQPKNLPTFRAQLVQWQLWAVHCKPQWKFWQTAEVERLTQQLAQNFAAAQQPTPTAEHEAVARITAEECQSRMEGFRGYVTALKTQLATRTSMTDQQYATWKETRKKEQPWIESCRQRIAGWDLPTSLQADLAAVEQRFAVLPSSLQRTSSPPPVQMHECDEKMEKFRTWAYEFNEWSRRYKSIANDQPWQDAVATTERLMAYQKRCAREIPHWKAPYTAAVDTKAKLILLSYH